MGQDQEGVLVHLVRVFGRVPGLRCEGEFCDAVVELFACLSGLDSLLIIGGGHFLRDRGSHVLGSYEIPLLFTVLAANGGMVLLQGLPVLRLSISLVQPRAMLG